MADKPKKTKQYSITGQRVSTVCPRCFSKIPKSWDSCRWCENKKEGQ